MPMLPPGRRTWDSDEVDTPVGKKAVPEVENLYCGEAASCVRVCGRDYDMTQEGKAAAQLSKVLAPMVRSKIHDCGPMPLLKSY